MYKEYACYDYSINEIETSNNIVEAIKLGISNIFVLPFSLNSIKTDTLNLAKIGCPIDYPYGLSDIKSRQFMIEQVIKTNKISMIDLMIPTKAITNRKYDKFREDIKTNLEICEKASIQLRYMLEYRVYGHEILAKTCQILKEFGISTILPSTGMMLDDINDNLIACSFLKEKSGINTICTGNIYLEKHMKNVINSNVYGMRYHHLNILKTNLK